MSSDDGCSSKNSSPFLSLFSRKKRINGSTKTSDDVKVTDTGSATVALNGNGQIPANGYIDSENSESLSVPPPSLEPASTSWAEEPQQLLSHQEPPPPPPSFTFTDRVRYHKSSRKHKRTGTTDGAADELPPPPHPGARSRSETRTVTGRNPVLVAPKKAYSVDAVNQSDPAYLMEALETLADPQPRVARSIPKHAVVDTSNFAARSLDNCLFDAQVYDAMLHDSIKVCEMLQNHLTQCIVTVRAKSPEGRLEVLTEESEEEDDDDTETTYSQEKQAKGMDHRLSSTITSSSTPTSSLDGAFDNCHPHLVETSSRLKPKVQFKDC